MVTENPYAAPLADLTPVEERPTGDGLAERSDRFVAAFLDGLISYAYIIPLFYFSGTWGYIARGQQPPPGLLVVVAVLGFLGFLLIHGYFLMTNGQTLGKKMKGIRITDLDGNVPSFGRLVLGRYLPISVAANIPAIGTFLPLLDVLFIFRGDRRCIHDLIAGTKVVKIRRPYAA